MPPPKNSRKKTAGNQMMMMNVQSWLMHTTITIGSMIQMMMRMRMRKKNRMPSEEELKKAHSRSVTKSIKKHYKRFEIKIHITREADLLDFIESKENKQDYIKNLILEDMKNE